MFRDAFRERRCIIPASEVEADTDRQAEGSILSFAGLWDEWHDPEAATTPAMKALRSRSRQFTKPRPSTSAAPR
jgi:putative SOS response-associated peptidase YedK